RSLHPLNTGGAEDKEDIWYADIDKSKNNAMSEPKRLEGILNNSGPNFVSAGGNWSAPKKIHIKNDYNLSENGNAYVSFTAGVIISAVERYETYGKRD